MQGIILEVVAILYLISMYAIDIEWGSDLTDGKAKLNAATEGVMEQVKDEDGIHVTHELKLKAIRMVVPIGIKLMVSSANKLKLFVKSR